RPRLLGVYRRRLVHRRDRTLVDAGIEPIASDNPDARCDDVAVAPGEALRRDRSALLGEREHRREPRRLGGGHGARIVAKIALRRGVDAIGADAGLIEVQVDLHDPPLPPQIFDQEGEPGLHAFANIAAVLPEESVLRGLLTDRGSAADAPSRRI